MRGARRIRTSGARQRKVVEVGGSGWVPLGLGPGTAARPSPLKILSTWHPSTAHVKLVYSGASNLGW